MDISRIGDFVLGWGESLVWDEERRRLTFVDCAARTLHWLDDGEDGLHTLRAPSMPTGVVPTDDGRLVVALDDGLHLVDPDAGTFALLTRYPEGLGARANDACADLEGNLITGTLNVGPGEGSAWWYSPAQGWRLVDPAIANTNGPAVGVIDGAMTLIIGDTSADYYAYGYDPITGAVGRRRVFGDTSEMPGGPDGATLDVDGGLWCALWGGGRVVRFTTGGLDRTVPMPVTNPTDVTFGGPELDRLYVVSAAGFDPAPDDAGFDDAGFDDAGAVASGSGAIGIPGALLVVDGLGVRGRPEPRFATAGTCA